jgi:uncharacterized metal-binding protein YceD (DUF177 family)
MSAGRSPVSFDVSVTRLPAKGMPVRIAADEDQRAALAAAHNLQAVESFEADLLVRAWKRDGVRVEGTVSADVVQTCVVTLEPLHAHVEAPVSAVFVPEGSPLARADHEGGEIVVDAEADDLPETFTGGRIDAGALAEEFLALSLDPYPRKPGVALEAVAVEEPEEEKPAGPLSEALRKLRSEG